MTTAQHDNGFALVASLQKRDPMCALFFTHLEDRVPLHIAQYGSDDMATPLASASVLVIIRGLFEFGGLAGCARRLGVPAYYFLDDNFMLIRENPAKFGTLYERYSNDNVRAALRQYAGVLLASRPLVDYFQQHRLHDNLVFYPPAAGPRLRGPEQDASRPLTIAFFGGGHRREPFARFVYPAIVQLGAQRPVRVVAVGVSASDVPSAPGVEVITPQYDAAYDAAIARMAAHNVDVLVHPSDDSANNLYKNPHVLINAHVIGAVPLFSSTPPYEGVAGLDPTLLIGNSVDAWFGALSRLSSSVELRAALAAHVARVCDAEFSGAANVAILERLLATHPAPSARPRLGRRLSAAACLGYGHARVRIQHRLRSNAS